MSPPVSLLLPRDAEATKRRLLSAATQEFARYGIAGARVDRIALDAQVNKAQIYHYFGSKDELFSAVLAEVVSRVLREAPLDAAQLPEYAGTLFDGYEAHPAIARLTTWYRLEQGTDQPQQDQPLHPAVMAGNAAKVAAISQAQAAGLITAQYPPEVLLVLVLHLAATWTALTPEYLALTQALGQAQRRQMVVDAVRQLVTP